MTTNELLAIFDDLTSECRTVIADKNHDYARGGTDTFHNFRESARYKGTSIGLEIAGEAFKKLQRLKTLLDNGEVRSADDPMKNVFTDCINYAVLGWAHHELSRLETENTT